MPERLGQRDRLRCAMAALIRQAWVGVQGRHVRFRPVQNLLRHGDETFGKCPPFGRSMTAASHR